jgi:hypothetical protein
MMREYRCDLHIHTCLSPCADLDMHPRSLVERAVARGLDIIAVCDHNASENVGYVIRAAENKTLTVVPGMEITSQEEVHVVALFGRLRDLEKIQDVVYDNLPGQNDEKLFGTQAIVNENGEVEGFNERLLIGATRIPLSDLVGRIHELGGIAIASHIDRESFSVISQLGFVDSESGFDALEVSRALGIAGGRQRYPELSAYPFVTSSDAHFIDDIGTGVTRMRLGGATVEEVKMACEGRDGRSICG